MSFPPFLPLAPAKSTCDSKPLLQERPHGLRNGAELEVVVIHSAARGEDHLETNSKAPDFDVLPNLLGGTSSYLFNA